MTDNRTTELTASEKVKAMLKAREADYRVHHGITQGSMNYYDRYTVFIDDNPRAFINTGNGDEVVLTLRCTPEQAIAATLGDDDYECRMDELLCRLTNGKWSKSRSYSVDFMVSCVDEAYEDAALGEKRTCETCDELGNADSFINHLIQAERAERTCYIVASSTDGLCSDNPRQYFELSCGHSFTIDGLKRPVACAVCGKIVTP